MLQARKATSPGRRHQVVINRSHLHSGAPEKSLVASGTIKRQGRGADGHITVRHRGGGVKKKLRLIEWRRTKFDIPAIVQRIEYDPVRSAHVALLFYKDGAKSYILAPDALKEGDEVVSSKTAEVKVGNAMPLSAVPV